MFQPAEPRDEREDTNHGLRGKSWKVHLTESAFVGAAFPRTRALSLQLTFLMDGEEGDEGDDDDEEQGDNRDEADFQGGPAGLLTQFGMSGLSHPEVLSFSLML